MLGALSPRSRSTNQKAQIATKLSAKIPPHRRKVDAIPVVAIISSVVVFRRRCHRTGADIASMRVGGPRPLINLAHSRGMYLRRESEPFVRWRFASGASPTFKSESPARGKRGFHWGKRGGTAALHMSKTSARSFRFNSAKQNNGPPCDTGAG